MASPDFRQVQRDFAAHLRDPSAQAAPGAIEERRLAVYRDLFFNNIDSFLRTFFPVLHSLYSEHDWQVLVRSYFVQHRAETPYFLGMAEEFLAYLESEHARRPCDPPFMRDLAHYEWLELALDVAEEELPQAGPGTVIDPQGDLLAGVPVISPLAVLAHYGWPVHRVAASHADVAPADTFLMVYRNSADQVRFLELNAVSARLFAGLSAEDSLPESGAAVVRRIAAEMGHPDVSAVLAGAAQVLQSWRERDIVLGTRIP